MKWFHVWTEQINQDMFDVRAKDEEHAKAAVRKLWRQQNENDCPNISTIEVFYARTIIEASHDPR